MKNFWAHLLLLMVPATCGATLAEFPVGFFGVNAPADARALAAEGFDAVQSYQTDPAKVASLAAEARRQGQLFLVSPNEVLASTHPAREYSGAVWYLQDEPDVNGVSRDQLAGFERKVRAWSPGAKTAFVVGDGHKAKDYPGIADAIMVDWYPVPHLPLESTGDHVRMTAQAAGGRKVWAVLQAMDWRNFEQHDPNKERIGRFPDMAEIRFMSYDAVMNGAQGVWYFAYFTTTGSNLSQTPELLSTVSSTARELRALAPIFARGKPIHLPFTPDPDGVAARAWTYRGHDYVVLANRRKGMMLKVPKAMLASGWQPLFEVRHAPKELLTEHDGAYYLLPYRVLVLKSRLSLRRLLGF